MVQPRTAKADVIGRLAVWLGEPSDMLRFARLHLGLTAEEVAQIPRRDAPEAMVHEIIEFLERRGASSRLVPGLLAALPAHAAEIQAFLDPCVPEPGIITDPWSPLETDYREAVGQALDPQDLRLLGIGAAPRCRISALYRDLSLTFYLEEGQDRLTPAERARFFEVRDAPVEERSPRQAELDEAREDRHKHEDTDGRFQARRMPLLETLEQGGSWVVLGDPGAGKSTALKLLAIRAAARPEGPLPLWASLEDFDPPGQGQDPASALRAFLLGKGVETLDRPDLAPLLTRALGQGPILLLLDGLDECGAHSRRVRVATAIEALVETLPAGSRIIASSRVVGYREAPVRGLRTLRIAALDAPQVEAFVRAGLASRAGTTDEGPPADGLLRALKGNPATAALTSTPLLLTFLVQLYAEGQGIPTVRAALYRKVLDLTLRRWPTARSGRRDLEDAMGAQAREEQELVLEALALRWHLGGPERTRRKEDLLREIADALPKVVGDAPQATLMARARAVFDHLRGPAGALCERGRDRYSFQHRTLQEFLVGCQLARMGDETRWARIHEHLHDPRWREPLLLCAGWMSVAHDDQQAPTRLIAQVASAASPDEDLLHRDLLLAADLLAELDWEHPRPAPVRLLERIVSDLVTLIDEVQPQPLVAEALARLGRLTRAGCAKAERALVDLFRHAPRRVQDRPGLRAVAPQAIAVAVELLLEMERPTLMRALLDLVGGDSRHPAAPSLFGLAPHQSAARIQVIAWLHAAKAGNIHVNDLPPPFPHLGRDVLLWPADLRDAHLAYALWRVEHQRGGTPADLTPHAAHEPRAREALLRQLRAPRNPRNAANAAQALEGAVEHPEVRAALLEALHYPDPRTRELASTALGPLLGKDPEVRQAMLAPLSDPASAVRQASARAWLRHGASQDAEAVLRRSWPDPGDRRLRVELVSSPSVPQATARALIVASLDDEDPEVRRHAADQARAHLAPSSWESDDVRSALAQRVTADRDDRVRQQALRALGACASADRDAQRLLRVHMTETRLPSALAAAVQTVAPLATQDAAIRRSLVDLASHPDVGVRAIVARALRDCPQEEAREALLHLLEDDHPGVRTEAANALCAHLDDRGVLGALLLRTADLLHLHSRALFEVARREPRHPSVRIVLAQGLNQPNPGRAAIMAFSALPPGDGLLTEAGAWLEGKPDRWLPVDLGWIDLDAAAPRFASLLHGGPASVLRTARSANLAALARHSGHVQHVLERSLEDPDPRVRASAVMALATCEAHGATRFLEDALASDEPRVLATAILHLSWRPPYRELARSHWVEWCTSEHGVVRTAAAATLAGHPEVCPKAEEVQRRWLQDPLACVRAWAVWGLGARLTSAAEERAELLPWLGAAGDFVAYDAYGRHAEDQGGIPLLAADELRRHLAHALAPHVAASELLQAALLEMLDHPRLEARQGATWALWASGWDRDRLRPRLQAQLHDLRTDRSWALRVQAAGAALTGLEPSLSQIAHQTLTETLLTRDEPWRGEDPERRQTRLNALAQLAETYGKVRSAEALTAIRAPCHDLDPKVRDAGWRALRRVREIEAVIPEGG